MIHDSRIKQNHPTLTLPEGEGINRDCFSHPLRGGVRGRVVSARGFSLIETLVATAIIVLAAVGPLALAARSLAQANYIKDQIVATFLAQEGLEIMRNVRDTSGIGTIEDYVSPCADGCTVSGMEFTSTAPYTYVITPPATDRTNLKFNTVYNVYEYTDSDPTLLVDSIYTRRIIIERVVTAKEYKVRSILTWRRGYGSRTIELTENLFDRTW